jgi:sec-independent protein translocase protein TatA
MFTGILEPTHLIVVLVVALVFLGPKRLPGAGRAIGQGLKEFRESISGEPPVEPQLQPAEPQLQPAEITAQPESTPVR